MSTDRDTARIVRSWLQEGVTVLPDRVLDAVLDGLPAIPQARGRWPSRRIPTMNDALKLVLAGAAAVVVIGVGIYALAPPAAPDVGGVPPTASPSTASPTTTPPTPSPTTAPSIEPTPLATEAALPSAAAGSGPLAPGTYIVDDPFPVRVTMTVGQGWRVWAGVNRDGAAIYKGSPDPPDGYGIVVTVIDNVYADACDTSKGLRQPPLGPTADDLAAALAGQAQTVASAITDVTIDGFGGKYLEYGVPTLVQPCNDDSLHRWPTTAGDRQALQTESDMVWILDVDGVRVVIDAFSFPGATAADLVELRAIVESLEIGPPGAD
ncbi:MAG: hypothetical protein ACTS8Z_01105 [Candidatus Limnocylindrales bacterium]